MKFERGIFAVLVLGLLVGGNEAVAMNAFTRVGPDLAYYNGLNLFHPGHNNQFLWRAVYDGTSWTHLGRIHDDESPRSWPMTYSSPEAIAARWSGGIHYEPITILTTVFDGHNNDYVWYTSYVNPTGRVGAWHWQTPRTIPNASSNFAPSATMVKWHRITAPYLTVAYTKPDGRIVVQYGYECSTARSAGESCPPGSIDATDWHDPVELPEEIIAGTGPKIQGFQDRAYVFYRRGSTGGDAIYYTRNERLYRDDTFSPPIRLPHANTRWSPRERPVDTVVHDNKLIVAFVGHNNDHIFLVRTENGTDWESLGYIPHVRTRFTPSLRATADTVYLAFKEYSDLERDQDEHQETCVGELDIRGKNRHVWTSIRSDKPRMNCTVERP
jgi:hypothetical protein